MDIKLDHKEDWELKNWCFWAVLLEKTLESPLDCKEIKPVNPKGYQSWVFIGRTDAEAEAPIFWPLDVQSRLIGKDPDAGKDWRQEEKGTTEDEMVGWHHRLNGHEFEQAPGDGEGQGSLVCCSPWSHRNSDTTEWLNNNKHVSKWVHVTTVLGAGRGWREGIADGYHPVPWKYPRCNAGGRDEVRTDSNIRKGEKEARYRSVLQTKDPVCSPSPANRYKIRHGQMLQRCHRKWTVRMRHFLVAGSPLTAAHTPDRCVGETSVMKGGRPCYLPIPGNPWMRNSGEKIDSSFVGERYKRKQKFLDRRELGIKRDRLKMLKRKGQW